MSTPPNPDTTSSAAADPSSNIIVSAIFEIVENVALSEENTAEVAEILTLPRAEAAVHIAGLARQALEESLDSSGSDASTTTSTDSATSMSTSATTEGSDSTITPSGHNSRVAPDTNLSTHLHGQGAPASPQTPPRVTRNPFQLPWPDTSAQRQHIIIDEAQSANMTRSRRLNTNVQFEHIGPGVRRHASVDREGNVSFLRGQDNIPVICINVQDNIWRWVPFHELSAPDFIKYRDQISSYIGRVQSRARSNYSHARSQQRNPVYLPAPDERVFLLTLFNNHLEDHEKRRYIVEFSHTIIGRSHCSGCLKLTLKDKVKCIHYDCPGMCKECSDKIEDSCPICEKAQIITCPICKDEKKKGEIGFAPSGCGHAVCWACMGKAYQVNARGLRKCPQCREPWHVI